MNPLSRRGIVLLAGAGGLFPSPSAHECSSTPGMSGSRETVCAAKYSSPASSMRSYPTTSTFTDSLPLIL